MQLFFRLMVLIDRVSDATLNVPMLVMELYRLVPRKEDRYVHFHPFNMPRVKVRKIELMGTVANVRRDANHLFLTIEDGTGVVEINYKLERYVSLLKQRKEIDEKYRERAKNFEKHDIDEDCPKKFPDTRPKFSYADNICSRDKAILESKWWSETNNGLFGKEIQPFDYVRVSGYPCLDARFQTVPQEITAEFLEHARLTVFAVSVTCISEKMYNEKLSMWMNTAIRQRYAKR